MSGAVRLTDAIVARARVRVGGELSLADAATPGLYLRVRVTGAKTWVLRRVVEGRQRREVLGTADAMTLAEARVAARAALLGETVSPPVATATGPSFASFAANYRERMAAVWKPNTLRGFDLGLRKHLLPAFGRRPLHSITAHEVARWFHDCSRDYPARANHMLEYLRAMVRRARAWGTLPADAPDPTALVRRNPVRPRWGMLSVTELGRLGRALDALADAMPDQTAMIRLILLSGCRPGEIIGLRWEEVRADRLALIDSKTGPREVALPPEAIALLKARRPRRATGPVFPSPRDPTRPRRQIDRAWAMVKAQAGLRAGTRLHDLRHTYASRALMHGETLQMAGRLLGHKRTSTTERYAHLEDGFLAAAADRVAERVAKLLG